MDLFELDVKHLRALMDLEHDPAVLRILLCLEDAKVNGDSEAEVEAVAELGELLVLERGLGWE